MTFVKVFRDPAGAIKEASKGSMKNSIIMLLVSSILIAVGATLLLDGGIRAAAGTLVGVAVLVSVLALFLHIGMGVLTDTWSYYAGFTTLTLATYIKSVGILLLGLISLIPIPVALTVGISAVIMAFVAVFAFSVCIRTGEKLFDTDLLTMVIASGLIYFALFAGIYTAVIAAALSGGVDPSMMMGQGAMQAPM